MRITGIDDIPHYTYEDYLHWEGRWELIEGVAWAMTPAPSIRHQVVSENIAWQLKELLKECEPCRPLLPVDWKISDETTVQPDNLVICYEPKDQYLTKAPTLIFEILSPSTRQKDENIKFRLYEAEGVEHYILVDPDENLAKTYHLSSDGRYIKTTDASDETINFDLGHCVIEFDFKQIW